MQKFMPGSSLWVGDACFGEIITIGASTQALHLHTDQQPNVLHLGIIAL
jgi:hypothetical protein